jgi:ABC-type bacteriocin/lantibiotic exporter with double-glycine peptidase domain
MYIMCIFIVKTKKKKTCISWDGIGDVSSMCSRFRTCSNVSIFFFRRLLCMVWYGMVMVMVMVMGMICYSMLCYVVLCYVMLCYVMLCYVMYVYIHDQIRVPKLGSMSLSNTHVSIL